jgi:hypothetical protein
LRGERGAEVGEQGNCTTTSCGSATVHTVIIAFILQRLFDELRQVR